MLALIAAGVGTGVVTKRWGPNGVWGLILGVPWMVGAVSFAINWAV